MKQSWPPMMILFSYTLNEPRLFISGPFSLRMNGNVCNIGPDGVARRKRMGTILIIIAGFVSGFLMATHAPIVSRLVVFPIFMAGFVSLLESARKVCVLNSWRKITEPK